MADACRNCRRDAAHNHHNLCTPYKPETRSRRHHHRSHHQKGTRTCSDISRRPVGPVAAAEAAVAECHSCLRGADRSRHNLCTRCTSNTQRRHPRRRSLHLHETCTCSRSLVHPSRVAQAAAAMATRVGAARRSNVHTRIWPSCRTAHQTSGCCPPNRQTRSPRSQHSRSARPTATDGTMMSSPTATCPSETLIPPSSRSGTGRATSTHPECASRTCRDSAASRPS